MADFSVDLRRFFGFRRIFGGFVAEIGGRWNKKWPNGRDDPFGLFLLWCA